jgi:hypothetical protein
MVWYFMCDNNGIYPQTFYVGTDGYATSPSNIKSGIEIRSQAFTGKFHGLLVINESVLHVRGNYLTTPTIQGAVFAGCPYSSSSTPSMSDITLEYGASVAYDQAIIDAVAGSALTTTTTVTQIVPGSWQQLPVN